MALGLLAQALGAPLVLPGVLTGVGIITVLYFVPPTARAREARRTLSEWRDRAGDGTAGEFGREDPRIRAAEAMLQRISEHAGDRSPSAEAAEDLLQTLFDGQEDLRAIRRLRSVRSEEDHGDRFRTRAATLEAHVHGRMNDSLEALAEIFEAVLAHDAECLRKVLARVNNELHRLRAAAEIDALTAPD